MALTDAYATVDEYATVLDKSDPGDDAQILRDLTAVSRYLDRELGRFFTHDDTAQARIYPTPPPRGAPRYDWAETENPWRYGAISRQVVIDDLVSVTAITIDAGRSGTFTAAGALAAADYELLPRNAALGPEARPYSAIELTPWGAWYAWPVGTRVQVTGVWGWPAVPDAIRQATIQLTGILRLESPRATSAVDDIGRSVEQSRPSVEILTNLKRHYRRIGSLV